jgi:capsular exopolysaccharide synthesis family protein
MELWYYYRILRKRRWLILVGSLVCVAIVFAATYLRPHRWIGYTTVTERIPTDSNVTIFTAPYVYQTDPKLRITNLIEVIKSRTVLERSAQTLIQENLCASPKKVLSTIDVHPVRESTMLSIEIESRSASEAKDVVSVITAEFISFYNELNSGGATRSREFIQRELPKAEARLKKAQAELRRFEEEGGVVMLSRQTEILLQQLAQLKTSLAEQQVRASQTAARVENLERELAKYPETRINSTVMSSNPIWQSLKVELVKQQIELQKMLKSRTLEHPEVQPLKRQVEETESKLADIAETVVSSTTESTNPVRDTMAENYVSSLVDKAAAEAACAAVQFEIAALEPEMQNLPVKEMRLAQLTLDEEAARDTYFLLRKKLDEATIKEQEAENTNSIEVVDSAAARSADPRRLLKIILACILSPMFCAGMVFLLNYLDNAVRTPEEAEKLLKVPVLAAVPLEEVHKLTDPDCSPVLGVSYQVISTNLVVGNAGIQSRNLLIASAQPNVGRSISAANLAITLARDGASVILVDSDLRQPAQHTIFKIENERGLSNILAGRLDLRAALRKTTLPELQIITSGPTPANPMKLLRSGQMSDLVAAIEDIADFAIFDSPAGIAFADSALLASFVKNVIIVYAAGTVPRGEDAEFRARLDLMHVNVIGAILNKVKPEDSHGYYHFKIAYEGLIGESKGSVAQPNGISGVSGNMERKRENGSS